MIGSQDDRQQTLFFDFCLEDHVSADHLLRRIAGIRSERRLGDEVHLNLV
jgi:hypothetical protein